jgi:preprotein translocase subunit SecF
MIGITIISDILLLMMIKRKEESKYKLQLIMIFGVIAGVVNKLFLLSNGIIF